MYRIEYLPIAVKDLSEIIDYISDVLSSPKAASDLIDEMNHRISFLAAHPGIGRKYKTDQDLDYPYRILQIRNYAVFYTIVEDTVEIHRIIYSKMDLTKIFKQDR